MLSSHLFKVIASFCGVILAGLLTLVLIDSFKGKELQATKVAPTIQTTNSVTIPTKSLKTETTKSTPVSKPAQH